MDVTSIYFSPSFVLNESSRVFISKYRCNYPASFLFHLKHHQWSYRVTDTTDSIIFMFRYRIVYKTFATFARETKKKWMLWTWLFRWFEGGRHGRLFLLIQNKMLDVYLHPLEIKYAYGWSRGENNVLLIWIL